MKMKETKHTLPRVLGALAFGAAALTAVHSLDFVWLAGFVYRDNIRGYVPAGLTGMMFLGLAMLLLLFRLAAVARRRRSNAAPYVAVGCLAAPTAVTWFSVYTSLMIPFLGEYSWQKDVTMSAVGGAVCTLMALVFYGLWLSKKADNNATVPLEAAPRRGFQSPVRANVRPSQERETQWMTTSF